jgi:hypothetical protein
MHPLSPHANPIAKPAKPARSAAMTGRRAAGSPSRATAASKGKIHPMTNPLDVLGAQIEAKLSASEAHTTHIAAQALTLRRPRRPSAQRAAFRTPPASR